MDVFLHVTRRRRHDLRVARRRPREAQRQPRAGVSIRTTRTTCSPGPTAASTRRFDHGVTWRHSRNLPISQFYKLGARQRRALLQHHRRRPGHRHADRALAHDQRRGRPQPDWYVPLGADGYGCAFDPSDPNIVYVEMAGRATSTATTATTRALDIQPQPAAGRAARALELGRADHHQPALADAARTSARSASGAATTAATPGAR